MSRAPALLGLASALTLTLTLAVMIGPVAIEPLDVWRIIGKHALPWVDMQTPDITAAQDNIVWLIRLLRVLLAAVIGAALAVVGVSMQAMVRNPMAEPYILGVSSGAGVGAVLVILLGWFGAWGQNALALAAFVFGLGSFALVFAISHVGGRVSPLRLILVGVAVSYVMAAVTTFVTVRARNQDGIQTALFWLAGTLAGARWDYLHWPALALLACTTLLLVQSRALNALVTGDETAVTLGVHPARFRAQLMVVSALLVGTSVAVAGAIGFVGLIMPHVVRLVVGPDHRRVLPISAVCGAMFLVWVDVAARTVVAPQELPIGVLTAVIGGPFFLWLIRIRAQAMDGVGR